MGYQRLAARLTHELRNPLNGAVVNLEVLRGRSARDDLPAAALRPFVDAAASELGRAVELVEALLQLARPASAPVDLEAALQPLTIVLHAVAARSGGSVTLERRGAAVEASVGAEVVWSGVLFVVEPALESGSAIRYWCERTNADAAVLFDGVSVTHPVAATLLPVAAGDVSIRFPRSGAA